MGYSPSFITGANAKVKMGSKVLAYAQDVSYTTDVATISVETMGRYEVVSNEPVAYFVSGSLSIIRYTSVAGAASLPFQAAAEGNGMGKMNPGTGGNASEHFDPANLLKSKTFDLEIFQKTGSGDTGSIIKLHNCRFTRKGAGINKRGILVDAYTFNAVLHDDDSTEVAHSGDPDLA